MATVTCADCGTDLSASSAKYIIDMEIVVPVVNDFIIRLICSVTQAYKEWEKVGEKLRRLHLTLNTIQASIEEAEQRLITNQAILLQLKMFTEVASQGYYLLDTFESQAAEEDAGGHDEVRNPYTLSWFSPRKRLRRMSSSVRRLLLGDKDLSKLEEVMGLLEAVAANLHGFNVLLVGYPRRSRRPYDTYLYAAKCMYGRQVEREQIISFLLEVDSNDAGLDVLPIIGRHRSGKKTLMENVCSDERVRRHFSMISLVDGDDLEGEMLEAPFMSWREGVVITNHDLQLKRCLFVIEFAFSVDQEAWQMFYNRATNLMKGTGSKIVIISCLKEAAGLGTTRPMTIMPLPPEQFWCFFKAIAFGSAEPKETPKLLSIGMQVAAALDAGFSRAHVYGSALRASLDVNTWSAILRIAIENKKGSAFNRRHYRIGSLYSVSTPEAAGDSCIFKRSRVDVVQRKVPDLTIYDLWRDLCTRQKVEATPTGEIDVVQWRSILPPYRVFLATVILDSSAEKKPSFAVNEALDDIKDKMFRMYMPIF